MALRLIAVIVFLAVVFGGIFGWKHYVGRQSAAMQGGPPPATVAASAVREERWPAFLQAVGSLAAVSGIDVTSEVAGQVSRIHFRSGQAVAEGELLLELDAKTDQAQLRGLLAERRLARLRYERVARLIEEKSVSRSDFDEASATLENVNAQVAVQETLIEKKRIRAPFAGRLGIRQADIGDYLTAGAAIVPLVQVDPIYVDFSLPERELGRISEGQAVDVGVQAFPERRFSGRIVAIDPGVQVGSRSLRVRGELDNPQGLLRPGMFADVRVRFAQDDQVVTVPDTAISYAPYGDSVFVISDEGGQLSVNRRQIETGRVRDGRVAVSDGLSAGERVVSAGHNKLRNGQAVVIDDQPAPGERNGSDG